MATATLDGFWDAADAADRRMYAEKRARQARSVQPAAGHSAPAHPTAGAAAPTMVPVLS